MSKSGGKGNKYYTLKTDDSIYLEIRRRERNNASINFLLILTIIGYALPVIVFCIFVADGDPPAFGFLFSLLIFWGISTFFLRLYLWNKYGKEIFIITKNSLTHYFDYKLFKDNRKDIRYINLNILYASDSQQEGDDPDREEGLIIFEIDNNEQLISKDGIPMKEIIKIHRTVNEIFTSKR